MKTLAKPPAQPPREESARQFASPEEPRSRTLTALLRVALAFMREQYGNRVMPDSSPMLEELRREPFLMTHGRLF